MDRIKFPLQVNSKIWHILIWYCIRLHIHRKLKISLRRFLWFDPVSIFIFVCTNAFWETLGHSHTDKHEIIWHICSPHCVPVYKLHLTEVAVFHPVYYINWSGRRPSPCWEPNMMWCGLTHHDVPPLCWLQALWWSLVLYLTACSYPNITSLFFDRGKNSMRCKTQTQLSAGLVLKQLHLCMLGKDKAHVTWCHTCTKKKFVSFYRIKVTQIIINIIKHKCYNIWTLSGLIKNIYFLKKM